MEGGDRSSRLFSFRNPIGRACVVDSTFPTGREATP